MVKKTVVFADLLERICTDFPVCPAGGMGMVRPAIKLQHAGSLVG